MLRLHSLALGMSALLAAALLFTGCGDDHAVSDDRSNELTTMELIGPVMTTTTTTTTVTTTETTTTSTTTSTTEATTTTLTETTTAPQTIGELPTGGTTATLAADQYGLTAEDYAFLSDTVFVGDSICSGLRVYGILPDKNVVAKGCVAARSIFDYTFDVNGSELSLTYALSILKPRYVVYSMGMNDVNMTTPEQYCENYDYLMKVVRNVLPDSMFFVASVTPITSESQFCSNERIDLFNSTMKAHLQGSVNGYVDVATGLKNWANALSPEYNGGDGVHLAPAAYYVYLNQVCDQLVDTKTVGGNANGVAYGWART